MATSSASPASAAANVASLTAPPTFSGVSKFATSLQQVLSRAVGIASLPLAQDQATLTTLNTTQTDIQGLGAAFTALQQAVTSVESAVTSGLLTSSVSGPSTLSATLGAGATAGTYTVAVGELGAYSTALSDPGSTAVTDPASQGISAGTSYTLILGTAHTPITATGSSLQDLEKAINTQAGSQVQATLVNVGSNALPDYRLSLQAVNLGTDAIDLTDASNNDLIASSIAGQLASYQIDGSAPVSSTSRTVTLS